MFAGSPFSGAPFAAVGGITGNATGEPDGVVGTGYIGGNTVVALANVYPSWGNAVTQTWSPIRFGWYLSNTFVYFYVNATSWNEWVAANVQVGYTIYATTGGVRRYYGVVTDLPVVSGISFIPQTLITVSNPEGHAGFLDQTCTFEVIEAEPMVGVVGNVVISASAQVYPSGVSGETQLGTATPVTNNVISVTGVYGTTALGTATVTAKANVYPTGVTGTAELGTVSLVTNNYIDVTGLVGTTALGTATASAGANAYPSGVSATSYLGTVTVIAKAGVSVTGVRGITYLNNVNVWGLVDDMQNPAWGTIATTQTPAWAQIPTAQVPEWEEVLT